MVREAETPMDAPCAKKITKEIFLNAVECPSRGWRMRRKGYWEVPTPGDLSRMLEGQKAHHRARELFPDGVFASVKGDSTGRTRRMMDDPSKRVLFECAFEVGPFVVRTDALIRQPGGWELCEFKSNLDSSQELLQDVGYSMMILRRAGVRVTKASLLVLDANYRYGMPVQKLFRKIDCTAEAKGWADRFDQQADSLAEITSAAECPETPLTRTCAHCPFLRNGCIDSDILDLPRIANWRLQSLVNGRVTRIADIPAQPGLLTPTQALVRSAVISGQPAINHRQLRSYLDEVRWPLAYLDFETARFALPVFPNTAPHEQLPVQYSIHLADRPGGRLEHREYLADHRRDCRRELAARLCADLEGARTIVCYSGFEKRVLGDLAKVCPELKDQLSACAQRLWDMERAFKPGCYYRPEFNGRSSLKVVLPAMVKGLSYDGLKIADGDTATAAYARMVWGECSAQEIEETRKALLAYCQLDTLATVKLFEALMDCCDQAPPSRRSTDGGRIVAEVCGSTSTSCSTASASPS